MNVLILVFHRENLYIYQYHSNMYYKKLQGNYLYNKNFKKYIFQNIYTKTSNNQNENTLFGQHARVYIYTNNSFLLYQEIHPCLLKTLTIYFFVYIYLYIFFIDLFRQCFCFFKNIINSTNHVKSTFW